jgi:hypothetical protein
VEAFTARLATERAAAVQVEKSAAEHAATGGYLSLARRDFAAEQQFREARNLRARPITGSIHRLDLGMALAGWPAAGMRELDALVADRQLGPLLELQPRVQAAHQNAQALRATP